MLSMFAAAMLQAAPAAASPQVAPAPQPRVLTAPDWVRRPDAQDFAEHYPRAALRQNKPGRAVMNCLVKADGALDDCKVTEEFPADLGFGEATLKMAKYFRMRPMTKDGVPVDGGSVRIPLRFVLSGKPLIDPYAAMLACYGQSAALAEREPSNREAPAAFAFFAAQAAIRSPEVSATPSALEAGLSAARVSSASGAGAAVSPGSPPLSECLDVFRKSRAQPSS